MSKNLALPGDPGMFPYSRKILDWEIEYQLDRVVGSLTEPIVVYPGWEDSLPEMLKTEIAVERMVRTYKRESDGQCGDVEAMAYLYTASLSVSLDNHWGRVYINLAKEYMSKLGLRLDNVPVEELTEQEHQMLGELKSWIRSQQKESKK